MKSILITLTAAMMALVVTLIVAGLLDLSFGESLDAWMGDKMLTWRYELLKRMEPDRKPDSQLLLVAIDQESVTDLGRWPFPRTIHGQFLQVLAPEKPKVVGMDILFTEKTARSPSAAAEQPANTSTTSAGAPQLQPDDQALVDGAKLIPHLVTSALGNREIGSTLRDVDPAPTRPLRNIVGNTDALLSYPFAVVPFSELRKVSTFGFAEANSEDRLRTLPLVVKIGNQVFPSFALQVLMQYWGVDPDYVVVDLGHEITFTAPGHATTRIPIDEAGEFLINYQARSEDFPAMSYSSMGKGLADKVNGRSSEQRDHLRPMEGMIVVVGVTLEGTDNGPTPIEADAPRVIAQLNVLNNILQGDYLHEVSSVVWMPLYALFLFALANLMLRVGIAPMIPVGLTAIVLLADAAFATLWFGNALMPVLIPEVGVLVLAGAVPTRRFFTAEREKDRIRDVLRTSLSDKVMNKMLEHPDNVKLGGEKQQITIMFCDIRNFTRYCDERDPQEVMDALNEYMEEMTQVVFRHDGTVDKYIGDCIMAFWNAPQPQADHAALAVSCALEMRGALARFEEKWAGPNRESFECGIGVHTGEALVGNMGSSQKRTYTAMGSTVNLASRLEALTKQLGEPILISQGVAEQLGDEFPLTDRGWIRIVGVARPVHVYAVISEADLPPAQENGYHTAFQVETGEREGRQPLWRLAPLPDDVEAEEQAEY